MDNRVHSIDIFRGLTIFLMVFVNEVAGVHGVPSWLKHVPADIDGMTFVDVVFPAFLFIVGMAIPFAIKKRRDNSSSGQAFWLHVGSRFVGLIVLGVFMVNSGEMNVEETLIPKRLWSGAIYVAAILVWNRYPITKSEKWQLTYKVMKLLGVLIFVFLFVVYRKGSEGQLTGMTPSWWGILGLIGWAYLIGVILYVIASDVWGGMTTMLFIILALLVFMRSNHPTALAIPPWLQIQTMHLTHALIVVAGIVCAQILEKSGTAVYAKSKMLKMLGAGGILFFLGFLTLPFGGVSKISASPSWGLYSAGWCFVLFPIIYWIVDVQGSKKWADFLSPAGKNPLLTYILPPLFYAIVGYDIIPDVLQHGTWGIIRSLIFALFILWIARLMTKIKIQLQL